MSYPPLLLSLNPSHLQIRDIPVQKKLYPSAAYCYCPYHHHHHLRLWENPMRGVYRGESKGGLDYCNSLPLTPSLSDLPAAVDTAAIFCNLGERTFFLDNRHRSSPS